MPDYVPIVRSPARYVPSSALAIGAYGEAAVPVTADAPLPVMIMLPEPAVLPLEGAMTIQGLAGPFTPALGRPIWLTLSGSWVGTVSLLRSIDNGVTRLPLTVGGEPAAVFDRSCNEPVAVETERAATYWLDAALISGTLTYRVAQ